MYRLMVYYLLALLGASLFLSGFDPKAILFQAAILTAVCYVTNKIFAKIFKVIPNSESFLITALILTLIIGPTTNYPRLILIAALAMASKYLLVFRRGHVFNPAAIAIALVGGASWWVGSEAMTIPILIGGLLILRKIRRLTLVVVFLLLALSINPALLFFAFVMLVEPQTSPTPYLWQIIYAALIALLFRFLSLEQALLIGNVLSFIVSPRYHFKLRLEKKTKLTADITSFSFAPDQKINFTAGQYIELTLPHSNPDNRGIRRFFTISSSPTENLITITSRFAPQGSSFKKALLDLSPGAQLLATSPLGEFTLPKNPNQKLAFIAGGIGITPFRSLAKFAPADTILLYSARSKEDFVFADQFKHVVKKIGRLEEKDFTALPDYHERLYYVSGPQPMVDATFWMLLKLGVPFWRIKRDFFPGYGTL